jgi:entericidin B
MTIKTTGRVAVILIALGALSACGNTIRGVGADAANTVNATQAAGQNVAGAARTP